MVDRNLLGGMKNALERGQPIQKVKQSFINAGYKPQEVEQAAGQLNSQGIQTKMNPQNNKNLPTPTNNNPNASKPKEKKQGFFSKIFKKKDKAPKPTKNIPQKQTPQKNTNLPSPKNTKQLPQTANNNPNASKPKEGWPKWLVITLILVSILIIIGAAVLGLML